MWDQETGDLDTSPRRPDGAEAASAGDELLHRGGTLPSELQESLELFDADLPLTETQRALVRAALGTARGREATWRWVRARA
jgi:hypothetical protein